MNFYCNNNNNNTNKYRKNKKNNIFSNNLDLKKSKVKRSHLEACRFRKTRKSNTRTFIQQQRQQ